MLVAIPVFISGIIKYGERISAFRLIASSQTFEHYTDNQLLFHPRFCSRTSLPNLHSTTAYEDRYLYEARLLFRMLFTNSVLGIDDHKITYDLISKKNTRLRRLKLIEVQVGIIMYDLHYSKARKVSFPLIILHVLSPSYPLFLH
uniref:DUF4220 domain-containing protein n=1 Tax=Populus davidiana TaxID=266767 RepID=A0A6M2EKK9_9ROSI